MREEGKGLRAVLFDMDGTIVDVPYDWARIKRDLQTGGQPILHHLASLDEPERTRKWRILEGYEEKATAEAELKAGVPELMDLLRRGRVKTALVTNNSRTNTRLLLRRFDLRFDLVMTREEGLWKPSAAPFREVMRRFGVAASECCAVGDSRFDLMAAREAGITCVFLVTGSPESFAEADAVLCSTLAEVEGQLRRKLTSFRA